MAPKTKKEVSAINADNLDDFSSDLIKSMNAEFGTRVAYNLGTSESPTHVKWWISTGSKLLDYAISNRRNGGMPSGRIIEISGMPSTGKSHIAFQVARTVQQMGGLVVYIDTENATPVEKLATMGIDVSKRFVYCDTHMTEEVFSIMESTIRKATELSKKEIPILVVWDSVAATSPKAELEGEYDKDTMGLQARVISKGMRKITGLIGQNNVTLICTNQVRMKIGMIFGDPTTTPGGMSIPFHATTRLSLTGGSALKDKDDNVIGTHVYLKTIKNKVAPPFRKIEFNILFGKGIDESEAIFDLIDEKTKDAQKNKLPGVLVPGKYYVSITGAASRTLMVTSLDGEILHEKKFRKTQFAELLKDDTWGPIIDDVLESIMIINNSNIEAVTDDLEGESSGE